MSQREKDAVAMRTENDAAWMEQALEQARLAEAAGEVPVGALVIKDGEIVGRGHNRNLLDNDPTAHAEMVALRQAAARLGNHRLTGCVMIATIEPCAMCAGALVNARVERLIFAAYDPKAGFCGSLGNLVQDPRLNHRLEVIGGFEEERSRRLLQSFFQTLRRRSPDAERWQSG